LFETFEPRIKKRRGNRGERAKKIKKGAIFNSGAATQPRRLAGHRAGTGHSPEKKAVPLPEF